MSNPISWKKAKRLAEVHLIAEGKLKAKYQGRGPLKMLVSKLGLKIERHPEKAERIRRRRTVLREWAEKQGSPQ